MAGQREIPVWEKYTLTIGENKLRRLVDETPGADWVLMNGNRVQIKRRLFERYIDSTDAI